MRKKTPQQLDEQYKRVLQLAFPKLRFKGMIWNWYKVYDVEPCHSPVFLRIMNAYNNTCKKRGY